MKAQRMDHQAADIAPVPPRVRTWFDSLGGPSYGGARLSGARNGPQDLSTYCGGRPVLRHDPKFGRCRRAHQAG
eukprot:11072624-Alexandrium_andersonii.AAC.1